MRLVALKSPLNSLQNAYTITIYPFKGTKTSDKGLVKLDQVPKTCGTKTLGKQHQGAPKRVASTLLTPRQQARSGEGLTEKITHEQINPHEFAGIYRGSHGEGDEAAVSRPSSRASIVEATVSESRDRVTEIWEDWIFHLPFDHPRVLPCMENPVPSASSHIQVYASLSVQT